MLPTDGDKQVLDSLETSDQALANIPGLKEQKPVLAIIGTDFACGKTVLMTGLAGMLRSSGFSVRAIKPLVVGRPEERDAEQAFISSITHTLPALPPVVLDLSEGISSNGWQKVVAAASSSADLTFVELPGSAATPLRFHRDQKDNQACAWKDSADLASEIASHTLLVAKHDLSSLETLTVQSLYLTSKGVKPLGLATVETASSGGKDLEGLLGRDAFELALLSRTGVPYLGCIKHSPSISVQRVNQGNLIKSTQAGLELLEMMKALDLPLPARTDGH